uniref:Uncharacterized protein n=1 Tax=Rhizophora mucronata TaxID=61149 RepID=A0A2P2NCR5_RHIMU
MLILLYSMLSTGC